MQLVHGLGRGVQRGVEAEGLIRPTQVIVDRLGHADDQAAALDQAHRRAKRAVAADDDNPVDVKLLDTRDHLVQNVDVGRFAVRSSLLAQERIAPIRRAEDRPAFGQDAAHVSRRQRPQAAFADETVVTVDDAQHLPAVLADRRLDDGAHHRIEARRISAAGQHCNASSHNSKTSS